MESSSTKLFYLRIGGAYMQKLFKRSSTIYFVYLILMIILSILLLFFGYRFIVTNAIVWLVINLMIECVLTTLCIFKRDESMKSTNIIVQLLPTFSLIYIIILTIHINIDNIIILCFHHLFCFLSCYIISLLCANKFVFRIIYAAFNTILLLFLLAVVYFLMIFTDFGKELLSSR